MITYINGSQNIIYRSMIATWLFISTTTVFGALPIASGNTSSAECTDAMKVAKAMYESNSPRLYAPLNIPNGLQSRLILGASELDISGGDALESTPDFEKLPNVTRSIYWSREAKKESRIVVVEYPMSWQGDRYSLYLLDEAVKKETFLSNIENNSNNAAFQPLIYDTWRPPIVFRRGERGSKWFVDVGQPFEILSDWNVYTSKEKRAICTISFHPPAKAPTERLPKQVVALTHKLDEALGPGNNEGTLQQTARTRLDAQHLLANAALRPWALSDENVYNSRAEVETGLDDWANVNSSRRRLRNEIRKAYPLAEHTLATYYARTFDLNHQKAQELASRVTDLIFRSYFVFPRGDNL